MTLDMTKVRAFDGFQVRSINGLDGLPKGVVTIPAEGFDKLVACCLSNGKWVWVHKNFQK
jgi:hypothetical protein